MRLKVELPTGTLDLSPEPADLEVNLCRALKRKQVPLNARCGEHGQCGSCMAELVAGSVEPIADEPVVEVGESFRTCRYRSRDDLVLRIPQRSLLDYRPQVQEDYRIAVGLSHLPLSDLPIGLAVDLGTTTVVMEWVNMADGLVIGKHSEFNGQVRLGDDVLTRINLCGTQPGALQELQQAALETIRRLFAKGVSEFGVKPADVGAISIAGNTTMLHLLAGIDPTPMGVAPFTPVFKDHRVLSAGDLGLEPASAQVHLLPSAAAYVGADLMAGVFASGLLYDDGPSMLVDIGTNGEILLKLGDRLFGCATAAGPAFEGSGLSSGMRAGRGAISHFEFSNGGVTIETIGNARPEGICGSAYVDILAEGRKAGILSERGRIQAEAFPKLATTYKSLQAIRLAGDERNKDVVVTEFDLASLLQAKAAIAAGIETLLAKEETRASEVRRLYLAGGFGMHLRLDHAIASGMLPGFRIDQIVLVGNTSLAGAFAALIDRGALDEMSRAAQTMEAVELNLEPGFEDSYIDHLSIP